ncbi:MAG: AAA family ATPase [Nitrosomonadales bacterium]|nr:AAA family ATPase [Nitrosomonadales bacterium]
MYQTYFGLVAAPFSIAPDPRYLYMSQRHQEALATLLYGMGSDGGFVLLTGEVGAGKTTICRCLLEQIPDACDVAYIFNPKLTVLELLSTICDEFHIAYPQDTSSIKQFVDHINAYLLESHARGRRAVLIIDEAQNLSADVLEQMRLLTNLETNQRKLLQILLLGQPELVDMLARPELRQLAQRIVARYHLRSLDKNEVAGYVKHRLEVAGVQRQLFPDALWGKLYQLSGGVPRVINVLCDRALLGAFVQGKERVDKSTLAQAAREVLNRRPQQQSFGRYALIAGLALFLCGVPLLFMYQEEPVASAAAVRKDMASPGSFAAIPNPLAQIKLPSSGVAEEAQALHATLELPSEMPGSRSKEAAFTALFKAWGVDYSGDGAACGHAELRGLQCRTAQGGLDELRQLNMPAVLHMRDERGREFYAALTKLDARSATFSFGAQTQRVDIGALALQWSGDYTLLIHLPRDVHKYIQKGARGPAVAWLGKQLAQVQGITFKTDGAVVFDDGLRRQVRQFQLAQGLPPDGAVGPRTLARLSAVTDQLAPRLSGEQGRK